MAVDASTTPPTWVCDVCGERRAGPSARLAAALAAEGFAFDATAVWHEVAGPCGAHPLTCSNACRRSYALSCRAYASALLDLYPAPGT